MNDLTPEQYGNLLSRSGMHPREVDRAVLYVIAFGFEALDSSACSVFRTPTCGDWQCVAPDHQDLGDSIQPAEALARDASLGISLSRRDRRAAKRRNR